MAHTECKQTIVIIGAGWYGCHIAAQLQNQYNVIMIDKAPRIFSKSSYYNQNRLHIGYHYCRDYSTRCLCKHNYTRFTEHYPDLIDNIENNFYAIATESILDFNTYIHIYTHEQFNDFTIVPVHTLANHNVFTNIQTDQLIQTQEKVINSDRARRHFEQKLTNVQFVLNSTVVGYLKHNNETNKFVVLTSSPEKYFECDFIMDCTYNQLGLATSQYTYECTCSLLYTKTAQHNGIDSITIMDGKFCSLYPRNMESNLYTLTDVEFTPLFTSPHYHNVEAFVPTADQLDTVKQNMERKISSFYPNFLNEYKYAGHFLAQKTKPVSASDSRDVIITEIEPHVLSVNCGKIFGIFKWEEYVVHYLKQTCSPI